MNVWCIIIIAFIKHLFLWRLEILLCWESIFLTYINPRFNIQNNIDHRSGTVFFFTYARIWKQEELKFKSILSVVSLRPSGCMKQSWEGSLSNKMTRNCDFRV